MFPLLEFHLSIPGAFGLLAALLVFLLPLVCLFLPETKDLSLESVREFFTPPRTVFYVSLDKINVQVPA
jgi:hypothetical protein